MTDDKMPAWMPALASALKRQWYLAQGFAMLPASCAVRGLATCTGLAGYSVPGNGGMQKAVFKRWLTDLSDQTTHLLNEQNISQVHAWRGAREAFAAGMVHAVWARQHVDKLLKQVSCNNVQVSSVEGLILTIHNGLQHSLCAWLAQNKKQKVWMVAQPPESSMWWTLLGPEIEEQHAWYERAMSGGGFLFLRTGGMREQVAQCWARGELVVAMLDVHSPADRHAMPANLLGRSYMAATGLLQAALAQKIPVWYATLVWHPCKQRLETVLLPLQGATVSTLLQAYLMALEVTVRQWPWAWWGWQWYSDWPDANTTEFVTCQDRPSVE